ncbi:hypothetical protein CHS0354_039246 [Potamilus streckersoni]|uniref:Uncharacterized protein n=1 Tax=Potamilus streckersoni TaxID=2493646 RepID=A0AAE0VE28_9BIVA|nr:hypothetical protein CHS0354_039246 [Potamilus streckersoni]
MKTPSIAEEAPEDVDLSMKDCDPSQIPCTTKERDVVLAYGRVHCDPLVIGGMAQSDACAETVAMGQCSHDVRDRGEIKDEFSLLEELPSGQIQHASSSRNS